MQDPKIIFEDDAILVLNKPSGLVVHGDGRTEEPTLADWLVQQYPEMAGVGEPWQRDDGAVIARPGIVHRLDRETSGVMVVAKTQESYEHLKAQFQERKVQKEYRVVVHGTFKDDALEGTIDKQIGKSPQDFRKWSAQPGARGTLRDAVTAYKVLEQVGQGAEGRALVAAFPETGRTHQIRVHLKAIHHPVVGDTLYGAKRAKANSESVKRMMLHAYALTFIPPHAQEPTTFTAPVPNEFDFSKSCV